MAEKKSQVRQGLDGKAIAKFVLLFIGNAEVGKSSIIMQYMNNSFRQDYYPTKEFTIYKKLYNFNPDQDEIDEYSYVEIMDTIALNTGRTLAGFQEFFEETLIQERDLHKANNKFPEHLKSKLKHDYYCGIEVQRGLFSTDRIMGYVFVFDFNNEKSFHDVLFFAQKIFKVEQSKKEEISIKVFVGNKRDDILINEFGKKSVYTDDMILDSAVKEKEYYNILRNAFNEDFAKENLFFTSAKFNINIQKTISKILNKINQNESLWKKLAFEKVDKNDKKKGDNGEDIVEEDGFFSKLFCLGGKKVDPEEKKKREEEELLEEQEENMRFQDDEEEDDGEVGEDPDMNVNFKKQQEEELPNENADKNVEGDDKNKQEANGKPAENKSSCVIY